MFPILSGETNERQEPTSLDINVRITRGFIRGIDVVAVRISIEPRFLGPASLGTVEVIQLVRTHAGLDLEEAKHLVDRCVFGGESALVPMPSCQAAEAFTRAVSSLPGPAKVQAAIES